MISPLILVQHDDFDQAQLIRTLTEQRTDVGAVVNFIGYCRDEGGSLAALELEHYPGMAEAQLQKLADLAIQRWPLLGLVIVHRCGMIRPGEQIVCVAVAASHRRAAFEAADFLMDYLKSDAPFWKKQHPASGAVQPSSAQTSPGNTDEIDGWVSAKTSDLQDKSRW